MISKKSSSRLHFESRAKMLKCKRSQQEIIVTVLLVLIALAAVAAVATFVINSVKKSTAGGDDKLNCAKIELSISDLNSSMTSAVVRRLGVGDVALKNVTLSVNGVMKGGNKMDPGESIVVSTGALTKGDKVEAAAILEDGSACAVAASTTVA